MASIDLKKTYREHYTAKVGKPGFVEVPERPFLVVDGEGSPAGDEYRDAIEALYPIAYGIRAEIKKATGDGYTVMPLQGLWWADDMDAFVTSDKDDWKWRMMICQPDLVSPELAAEVIPRVTAAKGLVSGAKVRLEMYREGMAAQVMHLGPYSEEAPTIAALHQFIADEGYELSGLHHEIYLGDPRKADPAKLRTIIRQPVTKP